MAFQLWHTSVVEQMEQMAIMKKAGARLVMRGVSMVWECWWGQYRQAKEEKEQMLRGMNRGLSMGFETWLTSYRERQELTAFMKKVGAKIVNRGMAMGWAAWASMYWERREQLEFL